MTDKQIAKRVYVIRAKIAMSFYKKSKNKSASKADFHRHSKAYIDKLLEVSGCKTLEEYVVKRHKSILSNPKTSIYAALHNEVGNHYYKLSSKNDTIYSFQLVKVLSVAENRFHPNLSRLSVLVHNQIYSGNKTSTTTAFAPTLYTGTLALNELKHQYNGYFKISPEKYNAILKKIDETKAKMKAIIASESEAMQQIINDISL